MKKIKASDIEKNWEKDLENRKVFDQPEENWEKDFKKEFFSEKTGFAYGWSRQDSSGFIKIKDFIKKLLWKKA